MQSKRRGGRWLLPLAAAVALACGGRQEAAPSPSVTPSPTLAATPSPTPTLTPSPTPTPAKEPRLETVVANARFPVALAFAPDGRLFYNELLTGQIRIVVDGVLQEEPFATLPVVRISGYSEHGLLGLALDPNFADNRYVYAFHSLPDEEGRPLKQRVVRFREVDGRGTDLTVIVDDLPVGQRIHNGGRLAFGPDGKLYVSIGDTERPQSAQDPRALSGKILRLNPDGSLPGDNPIAGSPVFALGLRNVFGLAFDPVGGRLFATENGPVGSDEINLIRPGGNYGWPQVMGIAGDGRFLNPLLDSGAERLAPTGITVYRGDDLPFAGDVFFCSYNSGTLLRISGQAVERVEAGQQAEAEALDTGLPCSLDVVSGPDGALYFSDGSSIYRWGR